MEENIIEVFMTPFTHDSPNKPYFWMIKGPSISPTNKGHGWGATPEEAWKEALDYYNKYFKGD